ncbi:MAG: protoheme IX farnesyltransferase [Myxococcota bacterium]|jgi:protoheme IX farnesyltransferase
MPDQPATFPPEMLRDLIELTKPSILLLSVMMAALGLWLAPNALDGLSSMLMLLGTGLVVGSANALNMYWERDVDGLMGRTKNRPLPTGRMVPAIALWFGVALGLIGAVVLYVSGGALTAALGIFALLSYVLVYTPLKRITPHALIIGAVPGAMPPLMGWAAATGRIDGAGLVLFGVLLLWQMPHFLAIAIYRKNDYAGAGFKTTPVVRGTDTARWQTVAWATTLIPASLLLLPLGAASWIYGAGALGTSLWFLYRCLKGYNSVPAPRWARSVFLASLVYLPSLGAALILDRVLL